MPAEFWITYLFTSRVHLPPTTQLIELENPDYKLADLEDVLEHGTFWVCRTPCNSLMVAGALVFRQGFVDAKYRPATWWEKDGVKVKTSAIIADLLTEGVGICPDAALTLVIGKRCIKNHAAVLTLAWKQRMPQRTYGLATFTSTARTPGSLPSVSSSLAWKSASRGLRTSPTTFLRRASCRPSTVHLSTGIPHVAGGSANSGLLMRSWSLVRVSARRIPYVL